MSMGWLSEQDSMVTYIPPAILMHAGYALGGRALDNEGNFSGPKVSNANLEDAIREMIEGTESWDPNPFAAVYSYPGNEEEDATLMTEFATVDDALTSRVGGLPKLTTVDTTLGVPTIAFTNIAVPDILDDATDEAVLEYSARASATHDDAIARYKAAMFAQDAHLTSAFYLGLAIMHTAKAQDINTFRGRLFIDQAGRRAMIELEAAKANFAVEAARVDAAFRQWSAVAQLNAQIVDMTRAINFAHFEAGRTRYDMDVQYNQAAVGWKFQNVMRYAQLTVPTAGMPLSEPQPTRLERILSSALSIGSNMGMQMGDKFGPVGGIIGAVGGGALGAASQMLR